MFYVANALNSQDSHNVIVAKPQLVENQMLKVYNKVARFLRAEYEGFTRVSADKVYNRAFKRFKKNQFALSLLRYFILFEYKDYPEKIEQLFQKFKDEDARYFSKNKNSTSKVKKEKDKTKKSKTKSKNKKQNGGNKPE
jgi:hypothetical protein